MKYTSHNHLNKYLQVIIMCGIDKLASHFYNFTSPLDIQEKNLELLIAYFLNLVAKVGTSSKHFFCIWNATVSTTLVYWSTFRIQWLVL